MKTEAQPGGSWRLLLDPPGGGAWNLALDEALLDACLDADRLPRPTVRIYGWQRPALSLGRWQDATSSHCPSFLRDQGINLVRRPTGGRAVLHEHERTYAVVGRLGARPFTGGVVETYGLVARAVAAGLARLGLAVELTPGETRAAARAPDGGAPVAACFATVSAHEIVHRGLKLVGAAQLRRRGAFLQHGSIPIRSDPRRLAAALGGTPPRCAWNGSTDLESALGRTVEPAELDAALVCGFSAMLGARCEREALAVDEGERAAVLARRKYASATWTLEGRVAGSGAVIAPSNRV